MNKLNSRNQIKSLIYKYFFESKSKNLKDENKMKYYSILNWWTNIHIFSYSIFY